MSPNTLEEVQDMSHASEDDQTLSPYAEDGGQQPSFTSGFGSLEVRRSRAKLIWLPLLLLLLPAALLLIWYVCKVPTERRLLNLTLWPPPPPLLPPSATSDRLAILIGQGSVAQFNHYQRWARQNGIGAFTRGASMYVSGYSDSVVRMYNSPLTLENFESLDDASQLDYIELAICLKCWRTDDAWNDPTGADGLIREWMDDVNGVIPRLCSKMRRLRGVTWLVRFGYELDHVRHHADIFPVAFRHVKSRFKKEFGEDAPMVEFVLHSALGNPQQFNEAEFWMTQFQKAGVSLREVDYFGLSTFTWDPENACIRNLERCADWLTTNVPPLFDVWREHGVSGMICESGVDVAQQQVNVAFNAMVYIARRCTLAFWVYIINVEEVAEMGMRSDLTVASPRVQRLWTNFVKQSAAAKQRRRSKELSMTIPVRAGLMTALLLLCACSYRYRRPLSIYAWHTLRPGVLPVHFLTAGVTLPGEPSEVAGGDDPSIYSDIRHILKGMSGDVL